MPEKQLCGKCKRPLKGTWETVCKCSNPEPQILCRNCGKPKGEHKQKYSIVPEFNGLFCDNNILLKFEPSPQAEKKGE